LLDADESGEGMTATGADMRTVSTSIFRAY
jgi:hypothetical protein